MQRLRRIRQLGLTHYVYPGALHTRFHHALGAYHLMQQAVESLRAKGIDISAREEEAVCAAILLHDVGHSPFSHALEHSIVKGISHEKLSALFIEKLNKTFNGKLETAIQIFNNTYPKKFLHRLISSQLDMDRLDYLSRDSFFTGVSEGVISEDRIIKMLGVHNDELVVDAKGIYSIEKFIIARRLMYWQVYLHKTVLAAEQMLEKILQRARELTLKGEKLFAAPSFSFFLQNDFTIDDFKTDETLFEKFILLDDYDIFSAVKEWSSHSDTILSLLSKGLVMRKLYKIRIENAHLDKASVRQLTAKAIKHFKIAEGQAHYFVNEGEVFNYAYNKDDENISIRFKDGKVMDVASASDQLNISVLSKPVKKYFICFYRDLIDKDE